MSVYEEARSRGQDYIAAALLATAERILVEEGAGALSMRRVASAAGCSTQVLYSLFGSKNGLIDGLFADGFRRLREALDALSPATDPLEHLIAMCRAYRWVALANPHHYAVIFGNAVPDYTPSDENARLAKASLERLAGAIADAAAAGRLDVPDPDHFAMLLWSATHGFVSLELAGYTRELPNADALYDALVYRLLEK
jgi:AcrR family transcriptional regulator